MFKTMFKTKIYTKYVLDILSLEKKLGLLKAPDTEF